jgi:hypothetical protein
MVKGREGVVLDRLRVCFDDERAVANAGLLLLATLAGRLGIEQLVNETVDLSGRPGGARPGRKVLTLCHAMHLGADSIDDCDVLRSGRTGLVLGHGVLAPSTLGTFLRSFTFGHVRQLDRVLGEALGRAWAAGAGPGEERLVIDLDSFVGEVHGYEKEGAAYGYTRELGYHPLLATRAGTDETLHVRLRKGSANTQRGAERFVDELIARVRRAGATGEILVAPTPASGTRRSPPSCDGRAACTRSESASPSRLRLRSRRSRKRRGSRSPTTPRQARRRSPRQRSARIG